MTRENLLCRIKRQIRMGVYESDEKQGVAVDRLIADVKSKLVIEPSLTRGPRRSHVFPVAPVINN